MVWAMSAGISRAGPELRPLSRAGLSPTSDLDGCRYSAAAAIASMASAIESAWASLVQAGGSA